ncbi:hypothetical protein [Nocardia sp. NPDC047648]
MSNRREADDLRDEVEARLALWHQQPARRLRGYRTSPLPMLKW